MAEGGDLIGPYRLVSLLGKGAMGEVWRARDERLDRYVAVKVLPAGFAGDVERRARMLREARAAAAIRHANVVTLFDIVTHAGDDILVMELVEGRTLSEALRQAGPPALEVALRWIEGVADALVAAHGRGILHRDIKAANIMVTPEGVKVLDFGLAKLVEPGAALAPAAAAAPKPPAGARIALDETMPSGPIDAGPETRTHAAAWSDGATSGVGAGDRTVAAGLGAEGYRTHAGQLLGTPLYMAPEQIAGALPDVRSEVFSVGVLAHEILRGKPPYSATTMDALFAQITEAVPPDLDEVPAGVAAIVRRALAKDPGARYPTMSALRDAVVHERRRLFTPAARRWPLVLAAAIAVLAVAGGVWAWHANREPPARPGDAYVRRALEEYDLFYNDKALSSLRAALAVAPGHPRALAYLVLFAGGTDAERATAADAARHARADDPKDRALLDAAIALVAHGPQAARTALAGIEPDRELAFWTAELDYRAANYRTAHDEYHALLAAPARAFRGRCYDHDSSILLYLDEPTEALRIGTLYRDAFPGEADAVGVYATTLAAAGQLDLAIAAAEDALRLSEGEDTLAGLAKVVALSGDRPRAKQLYQRSLDKAGPNRRPLRRAALGLLHLIDGELDLARAAVAPCLAHGADATARERGACLFVAGIVDPAQAEPIAAQLDALAQLASDTQPAYGSPRALAQLVRARAQFFGGACLVATHPGAPPDPTSVLAAYAAPVDFYAAYHLPFFTTWQLCEHAALLALTDPAAAFALLEPVATRAPHRTWLLDTLRRYRSP
jgi:serine/threonine protein kinase/tetratricopeptide (TPR) repeat protein